MTDSLQTEPCIDAVSCDEDLVNDPLAAMAVFVQKNAGSICHLHLKAYLTITVSHRSVRTEERILLQR